MLDHVDLFDRMPVGLDRVAVPKHLDPTPVRPLSTVTWSEKHKVPLLPRYTNGDKHGTGIASDVRPVFPEETRLLEVLLKLDRGRLSRSSVWATKGNRLIIDGNTVVIKKSDFMKQDPREIRKQLGSLERSLHEETLTNEFLQAFRESNKNRVKAMAEEASNIVKKAEEEAPGAYPFVSFSGGKDSTVVSDIVRRALGKSDVLHVFGNTTLEFPTTHSYIERFKEQNQRRIPFTTSKSKHDFFDLCRRIGPPSRVMRWCCTVFKTGPIGRKLDGYKKQCYLAFQGVRHSESVRRSSYEEITRSPKVVSQIVACPILHWRDADVWLYIIDKGLDFNEAYRYGYTRVGCWCCPSNSMWSSFLTRIFFPELAEPWRDFLVDFAKSMGKPDAEVYVDTGKWKARQGGIGVSTARDSLISSRVCGDDPNAKVFKLSRPISRSFYEYFKPFGRVDWSSGSARLNEVLVIDPASGQPLLSLQGAIGSTELRIAVIRSSDPTLLFHRIDCQLRKFQSCILCGGCLSACLNGAIEHKNSAYFIDESRCSHCLQCINKFDTGCLVSKVLQIKRGASS